MRKLTPIRRETDFPTAGEHQRTNILMLSVMGCIYCCFVVYCACIFMVILMTKSMQTHPHAEYKYKHYAK